MSNQPHTGQPQRRQGAGRQLARGERETEAFLEQRELVDKRIAEAMKWFGQVAPSHVNAEQFCALAIGHMHRNERLTVAAVASPHTLMVALVECARLGLVLGSTYHLADFYNKETGLREVTGMVDYKGEVELIYRTGLISAIHADVVRGGPDAKQPDHFLWHTGMQVPEHKIAEGGLADESERGYLRGAYAYAVDLNGRPSAPVVMSRSQVLKRRAVAKTQAFWGPDWPQEGSWTPEMWRKTPLHALYWQVPHSEEYTAALYRSDAAVLQATEALKLPEVPGVAALRPPDMTPALTAAADPAAGDGRGNVRDQLPANGGGGR